MFVSSDIVPIPAESATASFSLWHAPWITAQQHDGTMVHLGLEGTLLQAHRYLALYDPSPLVVVGIHRLLVAILQGALDPRSPPDLRALWRAGYLPPELIRDFGRRYAYRFDLFASDYPFLQSADLPVQPAKGDDLKSVSQLTSETSRSSALDHYRHGRTSDEFFCPACAAKGLVTVPVFTSSGGAGLKPSINGVPPIYMLPVGSSLYETLLLSLVLPDYQPEVADRENDAPWWTRSPIVGKKSELLGVGYLHSLTFPARRVRLHPEMMARPCTRCGQISPWGVRTMIFEMGESRPKDAPAWFDPFAAYRLPDGKSRKSPTPIRPQAGRALWRDYASLFLQESGASRHSRRAAVLDQMDELEDLGFLKEQTRRIRCVGLRTDMKAKVFEWLDATEEVPAGLLDDRDAGNRVNRAIEFATNCAATIRAVFRGAFSQSRKQERYAAIRARMEEEYWAALGAPFREHVVRLAATRADSPSRRAECRRWAEEVLRVARSAFERAAAHIGDDGAALHRRAQAEALCTHWLGKNRQNYLTQEGLDDRPQTE